MYTYPFKLSLLLYWSDAASLIASKFTNLININFDNLHRTEPILQKKTLRLSMGTNMKQWISAKVLKFRLILHKEKAAECHKRLKMFADKT